MPKTEASPPLNQKARMLPPDGAGVDTAVSVLRSGGLVAIPTETVYGLAADGLNPVAVAKIFAAKGRPSTNPLILHVASIEDAWPLWSETLSTTVRGRIEIAAKLWPGPLTIVASRSSAVPDVVTAGGPTVAVRVPDHPVTLAVLRRLPFPLAAPSANRSNYISPTTADHVMDGLSDRIDAVLDGGPCDVGLESAVLDVGDDDRPPRVLRPGAVTADELSRRLGCEVTSDTIVTPGSTTAASPGQSSRHYSPTTPTRLVEADFPGPPHDSAGSDVLRLRLIPVSGATVGYAATWTVGDDWAAVATNLYAMLRRADSEGFTRIDIDRPPGHRTALRDRLRRVVG